MLNTIGSLCGAEASGILDCTMYMAGVSGKPFAVLFSMGLNRLPGSCWALGTMYSGVAGSLTASRAALHLKDRIQISYLDMSTLDALVSPVTNKVRSHPCTLRPGYLSSPIYVI